MIMLSKISEDEFKLILNYIGTDNLRKNLIEISSKLPLNNPFFMCKDDRGAQWKNINEPNDLPQNRVFNFYINCVFKNKTDWLVDNFQNLLLKILGISENELPSKLYFLDEKLAIILNELFMINDPNYNKSSLSMKKVYEVRISKLINDLTQKNNELIQTKELLKEYANNNSDLNNTIKEKNNVIEQLTIDNNSLKKFISRFFVNLDTDLKKLDISSEYNDLKMSKDPTVVLGKIVDVLNEAIFSINSGDCLDIDKKILCAYVLSKLLEE